MDSSTGVIIFLALLAALFIWVCVFWYCRSEPRKTGASSGSVPREVHKVSQPPKNRVQVDPPELYDEVSFIIEDGHQINHQQSPTPDTQNAMLVSTIARLDAIDEKINDLTTMVEEIALHCRGGDDINEKTTEDNSEIQTWKEDGIQFVQYDD